MISLQSQGSCPFHWACCKDRLSHLGPWAKCNSANQWQIKSWVGEPAPSPGTVLPYHLRGKRRSCYRRKLSQERLALLQGQLQLSALYLLQHFCSPSNWVCWEKNNPFSPNFTLWNTLGPLGQTIPEALSGLGPFCHLGRCTVLCQWTYFTDRRHSSCYSSRQVSEDSGFWVREQGSKTKHSSRDGVTA